MRANAREIYLCLNHKEKKVDNSHSLEVLIIEDSMNDAEVLQNQLRNAGTAVRLHTAEDEDELITLLAKQTLDLAICLINSVEPTLTQLIESIDLAQKDIPILALDEEFDIEQHANALQQGVRDYVTKKNPEHFNAIVKREITDLENRRKLYLAEINVQELEKRCHILLDSSRDAIAYIHEGMHIYANQVYAEQFGFDDVDALDGMPIMDMIAPVDQGEFKKFLKNYDKTENANADLEVKGMRADQKTFDAVMEFSAASIDDEPCTQIIIRIQSNNKELEQKLKYLSKQDILTGLYNRHYFIEELEDAISNAVSGTLCSTVIYLEPDNIKEIKAKVGIHGTDLILSDIAQIITEHTGETIVSARFGDYSFTTLIPGNDVTAVEDTAEEIRFAIEGHISEIDGHSVTYTVSIGISVVCESANDSHDILTKADLACEMMHKAGGNRVHLHNPVTDLQANKDRDEYWHHMIVDSLENNNFMLFYQPIAALQGDTDERYEVLIRMRDSEDKILLPADFMPVAEETGLIQKIDRWVILNAIRNIIERRQSGIETTLFVKISGKSITDETILPWISQVLQKSRLPGNNLVFQITELDAVKHLKFAKVLAAGLTQLNCGFCIENFGNGMNSFQLLKHLDVTFLKIDGGFIHNLSSSAENQSMVKSIVDMAISLEKPVIAEFVEDAGSLTLLWQTGVQFIQGHFLQQPDANMNYDFIGEAEEENLF
ncbi:hypothetical protein MNBD_GAMMA12-1043 [hydrothermal vent metagenome]|uniref:Uncharacterized protein n=1 Tax=hydrothermal vent metagenome TaxID=652676 RepID=A0A3B0Z7I5_9ZZZZ